jgi:quercetin dioxygenase-like cupin family protein
LLGGEVLIKKIKIDELVEFSPTQRITKTIYKGDSFNLALICLNKGQEIPVHAEPYDVFFLVMDGKGMFTIGDEQIEMEKGSMIFSPAGLRGIKCEENLVIFGIQEAK